MRRAPRARASSSSSGPCTGDTSCAGRPAAALASSAASSAGQQVSGRSGPPPPTRRRSSALCSNFAQFVKNHAPFPGSTPASGRPDRFTRRHAMSTPPSPNGGAGPGAVPPHSIDAEQAVLGAILQSDRTHYAYIIEEGLREEDFYLGRHRTIFESMLALFEASEPIDVLTVSEHLRSRGKLDEAGGQAAIDELTAGVPRVGGLRSYGHIVKERALLRRLLSATYEIQAGVHGHDGEPRELIERAERTILEVAHDDRQKDFRKVGDVLHVEIGKWQKLSTEGQTLTGTPSGFADLDAITGGF